MPHPYSADLRVRVRIVEAGEPDHARRQWDYAQDCRHDLQHSSAHVLLLLRGVEAGLRYRSRPSAAS
jgi:hypothetical protein